MLPTSMGEGAVMGNLWCHFWNWAWRNHDQHRFWSKSPS